MPAALDCIELTRRLIRCPSVTPAEGGALDLVQEVLETLDFTCHRLAFSEPGTAEVDNLYARLGTEGANFCYAGHTDVVPVGETAAWSVEPFGGELRDGWVYGRGAVDMKGSIAAFLAALASFLERRGPGFGGSISLLITGDEEADAINGTRKVLRWLTERGERLDACLVGEPTSNERLGDMIKIGRRGSLNGRLTVRGIQGHTAYPQLADNPLHHLVRMLETVLAEPLDRGSEHFPPSTLQLTTIDAGNAASNVIPGQASAAFNVRFNDLHTSDSVADWLRDRLDRKGADYDLEIRVSGESFLCPPGPLSDLIARAVETVLGDRPEFGTTGGTSDARFIKDHAPVVEFGLLNATAHKVDERVSVDDLERLSTIYGAVLDGTFPQ
ncbi:MAG: succinyl-diaminopimelate desuccinylase [Rhodospirillales bacterium]|nr:succinyl-diaminopimelate desuccinylase [Rhodospirillales bacterium]MDH3911199.1 succinyl-diaminopimelate desuccinylase [Rhodospirillales bacterium]MDH3967220.1 succinyl-diaminopimelate desuccinylase [Rhodospirillales bacterium]